MIHEFPAVVGQDGAKVLDETFGLRVGKILARDEYMLVKRHVHSISVEAHFIDGPWLLPRAGHERLRGSDPVRKEALP
ncbi:hypothetical protein GCM10011534_05550 [Pseudooceanicola nanhaiensis]|uniref:Uncharacterized protein n=1 Tax=Pseudooceanicola nanhaiensis TaxID=375761 RepID=A0A917SM36_9RHOB|nr:hypothetical protein GCM10011534_05550 [Pseudooceanicola nanhaiensis]